MTKIAQLKKKMEDLKKEMTTEAKAVFKDAAAELFTKYPAMESFSFNAYTPYFCDGDPCEYSANVDADSISVNGICGYDDDDKKMPEKVYEKVSVLLTEIGDDCLFAMFGDHCEVTATRKGISVAEYQRD